MTAGPSIVKMYYRTGAFHRTDEFSAVHQLPFVAAHTFPTCTLDELSYFLAAAQNPAVLPSPAVGTRIAFRLVQLNEDGPRDEGSGQPRIVIKDLGSVVIGGSGPGAPTSISSLAAVVDNYDFQADFDAPQVSETAAETAADKTLADAYFAPGNFISCAIMPPLANGCVVPASSIRSGRGAGIGEASMISVGPPPPPPLWDRTGRGSNYLSETDHRSGRRRRSGDGSSPSTFGPAAPTGGWRRGDAPSDQDIWIRDGGRSGPIGGGSGGGGAAGRPGPWRRRNGR